MGVKITVEGSSLAEIRAALDGGQEVRLEIKDMGQTTLALDRAPVTAVEASEEKPAPAEAKKPVGRPRKAQVEETEAVKTEAPKAEEKPSKPAKKLSLDDVRTALQDFAKKQDGDPQAGILKVRELLMTFKSVKGEPCQKISELQDEDYPAVVAKCAA